MSRHLLPIAACQAVKTEPVQAVERIYGKENAQPLHGDEIADSQESSGPTVNPTFIDLTQDSDTDSPGDLNSFNNPRPVEQDQKPRYNPSVTPQAPPKPLTKHIPREQCNYDSQEDLDQNRHKEVDLFTHPSHTYDNIHNRYQVGHLKAGTCHDCYTQSCMDSNCWDPANHEETLRKHPELRAKEKKDELLIKLGPRDLDGNPVGRRKGKKQMDWLEEFVFGSDEDEDDSDESDENGDEDKDEHLSAPCSLGRQAASSGKETTSETGSDDQNSSPLSDVDEGFIAAHESGSSPDVEHQYTEKGPGQPSHAAGFEYAPVLP